MKSFKQYYRENLENYDEAFGSTPKSRLDFGSELEQELAKEMETEIVELPDKQKKYSIKLPDIKTQSNWVKTYIANSPILSKIPIATDDVEKMLNAVEKFSAKDYRIMKGEFGAKFGDVIVNSSVDSNNFETATLFIDTKVGKRISLRSLARFASDLKSNQQSFYLSKTKEDIVLIQYNKNMMFKIVKYFNDNIIVPHNAESEDKLKKATIQTLADYAFHKSVPAELVNKSTEFYKALSIDKGSMEIMMDIKKLKEFSSDNRVFTNIKDASRHIVRNIL